MWKRKDHRKSCKELEPAWEAYLDYRAGGSSSWSSAVPAEELEAHLHQCSACHEAVEAARLARRLLRDAIAPVPMPGSGFTARVMSSIRTEEAQRERAAASWRPLEFLASRLALTAAVLLLVLSAYLYGTSPVRVRQEGSPVRVVSENFPEAPREPATKDEVLLTLAGSDHGR